MFTFELELKAALIKGWPPFAEVTGLWLNVTFELLARELFDILLIWEVIAALFWFDPIKLALTEELKMGIL